MPVPFLRFGAANGHDVGTTILEHSNFQSRLSHVFVKISG